MSFKSSGYILHPPTSDPIPERQKNMKQISISAAIAAVIIVFAIWFAGANNCETPAGYVGYVTQGSVLGKTKFIGLQTGPTSTGRMWLGHVQNVSITPYTYTEPFEGATAVLSKDNLQIQFEVHLLWKVRDTDVQSLVEKFSTMDQGDSADKVVETAYKNYIAQPLRTFARDEVQKLNGLDVKDSITDIGTKITTRIKELAQGTPFEIQSVVIGNIQYPPEIANAVAKKLAATQELEQRTTQNLIAQKDAEKRLIEAEGIAKAMDVVQQKLTPMYLQHEAIQAQAAIIDSPNHTTIYIPVGNLGVPLVGIANEKTTQEPDKEKK